MTVRALIQARTFSFSRKGSQIAFLGIHRCRHYYFGAPLPEAVRLLIEYFTTLMPEMRHVDTTSFNI